MSKEEYYQALIDRGGGMITCGDHLGVMIGTDPLACPPGWVFLDIAGATVKEVREAVEHHIGPEGKDELLDESRVYPRLTIKKYGRAAWPGKASYHRKERR